LPDNASTDSCEDLLLNRRDEVVEHRMILGDCLRVMQGMHANSVEGIVTDPPYGQTNEAYDNAIAFDPAIWRECFRVAKDGSALLAFAGSPTYHKIASAIEAGGWKVRQMWAWVYRDGMMTSAYPKEGFDRLAPAMDPIVFATKGKVLLNAGREGDGEWKRERNTPRSAALTYSNRSSPVRATSGCGRYPRTLVSDGTEPFEYFVLARAGRYRKTNHPNEKPLELMRWLVAKTPGDTVLDLFAGSGTTGVACVELGRNFIGIESNSDYCQMAERRIDAATTPTIEVR
jgi:site-specific DNA-methyltransferase (adenine-specific)